MTKQQPPEKVFLSGMMRVFTAAASALLLIESFAVEAGHSSGRKALVSSERNQWQLASGSHCTAERLKTDSPGERDPLGLTLPTQSGPVILEETKPLLLKPVPLVTLMGNDSSFDFRATRWGMTMDEVKKSELLRPSLQTPTLLAYRLARPATTVISYKFASGKLVAAELETKQTTAKTPPAVFYADFERLTLTLCKLHGMPHKHEYIWSNETYKNDRTQWGKAICAGHMTCVLEWRLHRTTLELRTRGGAAACTTSILLKCAAGASRDR